MLSRNDAVRFLPQETHLFPLYWKRGNKMRAFQDSAALAARMAEDLPAVNYGWTTEPAYLAKLVQDLEAQRNLPENPAQLLRYIMCHWQDQLEDEPAIGEKTPAHIYYSLLLLKEFPDARLILMTRDPRAVALSELVKLKGNERVKRTFNAFNLIVRWSTAMQLVKRLGSRENVHFLTYEDLIRSPGVQVQAVCDFLKIDYHTEMLDVGVTNSSFSDKEQRGIGFNTDNLDRWKQDLSPAHIALIEHHLGSEMEAMGYPLTGAKEGLPSKSTLAKQAAKLLLARQANAVSPALFHHLNRNAKYKR